MLTRRPMHPLRRDRSGVAMTEFALTLPIFLIALTGGIELTNLALVHLRLNHVAETAADNASRVRTQMDENDIAEMFAGIELEGKPINLKDKGRLILSSVQDNGKTGNAKGQTIRWQRCHGGKTAKAPKYGVEGKGKADNALKDGLGPPGRRIQAQPGTAVMFVEVVYEYQPLLYGKGLGPKTDRSTAAINIREMRDHTQVQTPGTRSTCD